MIAYLKGKIINKSQSYVITEVQGVGYQVFVGPSLLSELSVGQTAELYIHQYVREDALDLYGFRSMEELGLFELLLSISGIGPKSALGVLSIASTDDIKQTIAAGDSSLLTKVSGIGKKTAERVVLELRDKVGTLVLSGSGAFQAGLAGSDEIDALIALGYSMQQARDALKEVDASIKDSGERIKQALKKLGR